jgi:hypothetical protein
VRAPELGRHGRRLVALDGLALQARGHRSCTSALLGVLVEGVPRVPGVGPELLGEVENCSSLSSAEWLEGWPSVGSDQPLIV